MGRRSLLLHAALPDQAPPQVSALQAEVARLQSALAEREDEQEASDAYADEMQVG